ncbi:MAG: hypothetical protein AB7O45_18605, partial [Alphaproteobacteria bacterium]
FYLREARTLREDGWRPGAARALDEARWCRLRALAHRLSREKALRRLAELEPARERGRRAA